MPLSSPDLGHDLYRILPAVYRERDGGDLRTYLAACGELLDRVHQTLAQRLADNFPDHPGGGMPGPDAGLASQDWLLPYFADLLDVRLQSPLVAGRRDEIARAIAWRQRKGTLAVIEQIVEAIGQTEAVLHEGWKRVGVTPRVDQPLLFATTFGYALDPLVGQASMMARHPSLPAATIDPRFPSGAVPTTPGNPGAQTAKVNGVERRWRQASVHGAPCHPGTYEDVSRRTVDLRSPDWRVGHHHPRRILIHYPPPGGFFAHKPPAVNWSEDPKSANFLAAIEIDESSAGVTVFRNKSLLEGPFEPVRIRFNITLSGKPSSHVWRFEGLTIENSLIVNTGRLELLDCAVKRVEINAPSAAEPGLDALDSLFETIEAPGSLCRLEYCTVLGAVSTRFLQASEVIFNGPLQRETGDSSPPEGGCVRFSRLPRDQDPGSLQTHRNTTQPVFFFNATFGSYAAGVLHPATVAAICAGAEDGGEMGAYHHVHHCQVRAAIAAKLADFLPLGQEALLIPDLRLLEAPVAPPTT